VSAPAADRYFRAAMRGEIDSCASFEVALTARDKRAVMEQRDLGKQSGAVGLFTVASDFARIQQENIVEVSGNQAGRPPGVHDR
jgi:hypothetical protein